MYKVLIYLNKFLALIISNIVYNLYKNNYL